MVSWRHLQPGAAQPRASNRRKRLQLLETPSGQAYRGERRRCSSPCCFDGVVNRAVLPATSRLFFRLIFGLFFLLETLLSFFRAAAAC